VTRDTFRGYFPYGSWAIPVTGAHMPNVPNTQSGAAKAPPIPAMDVTPPAPAAGREAAQAVKDIARQARLAAQDAKKGAQDAANTAQNGGHTATTAPPFAYDANNIIPPQAVDISVAFFVTVALCVVGYPLARAFGRRIDRKTEFKSLRGPDLTPHIQQLQESVDAMAIELERISEGQRFTAKLLADRSAHALEEK
jgi:hypothetical protein